MARRTSTCSSATLGAVEDRWLSADEIASYLGVVKASIYRWIDRWSLPAHMLGKLWKFKRDEVDAWVWSGGAVDSAPGTRQRRQRGRNQR